MKKILQSVVVIGLILAFSTSANAQVKFGAKAGLNISTLSGDLEDTKMKAGFNIGGVVNYSLNEKFDLQSGLSFTTKGCKFDMEDSDATASISLNYLEIPLNAIYKINKLQLSAGPYVAFALSGKFKAEYDGDTYEEDLEDLNTDFGLNFGIGYELGPVLVGLNYGLGLSNVVDGGDDQDDDKIKNGVISLTAAYMF